MKKSILGLMVIGVMASMSSAWGLVYTDENIHNVTLREGDVFSGKWEYGPIGSGETVTSVETWFSFSSTDRAREKVGILIGTGEGPIDYSSGGIWFDNQYIGNWYFDSGSILGDAANGYLSYTIEAARTGLLNYNDFIFESASVEVTTGPGRSPSSSVPDGGSSVALLGMGLLGLAGLKRRFQR